MQYTEFKTVSPEAKRRHKICLHCGKEFICRASRINTAKYCSHECRNLHIKREIKCANCGKITRINEKFCSMKCRCEYGRVRKKCPHCGKSVSIIKYEDKTALNENNFCSKKCYNLSQRNGKSIIVDDIPFATHPKGYYTNSNLRLKLHRYLWEKYHSKKIPAGHVVHHKDFNPKNNSIDNLQLITDSKHRILHNKEMWKKRKAFGVIEKLNKEGQGK